MAFYGPNNKLLIGDDGIVMLSSFDSAGVSAITIASTEFYIQSGDSGVADEFGYSLAIGSGRIVVGAPFNDYPGVTDMGKVFIYDLEGNLISTEIYGAIINFGSGTESSKLGGSVAAAGGRTAAGAVGGGDYSGLYTWDLNGENRSGIQTSGQYEISIVALGSGKLVVGRRDFDSPSGGFIEGKLDIWDIYDNHPAEDNMLNQTPITVYSPDGSDTIYFGSSVSVGHGRILASAYPLAVSAYPAYLFDVKGNYIKGIKPADFGTSDYFAGGGNYAPHAMNIGCGIMAIGSYLADSGGSAIGKVYIYDLNGNEKFQLKASDASANDWFGTAVAIGSNKIAVGAPGWNSDQGKVYVYNLQGDSVEQITASDGAVGDQFGSSIAFNNNRLVIGADEWNNASGKVYGYKLDGTIDTYFEDVLDTAGNNKWA
jgi:hypothetical protein